MSHPARNHPDAQGAGYPVHRVRHWTTTTHPNGVVVLDYVAWCGFAEERTGAFALHSTTDLLRTARATEMCQRCWA